MKKSLIWGWALLLVLLISIGAGAASFQVDGSFVFASGKLGTDTKAGRGFVLTVGGEVYPRVWLDGLFLTGSVHRLAGVPLAAGTSVSEQILAAGAKYKVMEENDLAVFLGLGWTNYAARSTGDPTVNGNGISGKLGVNILIDSQLTVVADLGYAPKFNVGSGSGTCLTSRVALNYEVYDHIGIQGIITNYTINASADSSSGTSYGAGVAIRF